MVSALSENEGSARGRARHLIRFFPAHWEKVYAQWLENIQDWCISRQVWWGHRIPAWYREAEIRESKFEIRNLRRDRAAADPENWSQDEDTLDTWFSSWLWAYETMDEETRGNFIRRRSRDRAGHYFLLGRAHDHCRAGIQARQIRARSKITFRFATFSSPESFATSRAGKCRNRSAIRPIRST